jgi:undecaprenyl-phosphate 4-deoxy-4-formamido-L-arabinose transferase
MSNQNKRIEIKKLSIVIPVYNGAKTIAHVTEGCIKHLTSSQELEIVLVNDGSKDDSNEVCKQLVRKHPEHIIFVNLSKNFGEHAAVIAGISQTSGEAVAILDDDGQNPPIEVLKLLDQLLKGYDVVYGTPHQRGYNFFRNILSSINDSVATFLIKKPPKLYLSSFKIISRYLADYIVVHSNPNPYLDSLVFQCTDNYSQINVNQAERKLGESNYTMRKLLRVCLNMMTTASTMPLRFATFCGITFGLMGLIGSFFILIEYFFWGVEVKGYVSLVTSILVFSGIQLFSLGVLGEYIGRLFQNSQLTTFNIRKVYRGGNS